MKKPKVMELPGIEGPGVAPISIPSIDRLADDYVTQRDKRCRMTPKEVAAKDKLIEALHKHSEKLSRDPEGAIIYRYQDNIITLKPGKESLKVKSAGADGEEE